MFQEKRVQSYLIFLKNMFWNIFPIGIGRVFKDCLFYL
ncbi:hypothetical protein M093_0790 [Bacteroides uniformis str. 3978 T3 i]|uniref:Uncharacterized protein n=1 Tax=Bacteroides uniformis str. 3978 T3 ii TaxID=1339349 RepID=A0A078S5G4_BACUN|nr:hypothetical protein M094_0497 [Bacteroides uniformis str. 3978 T3 ii]KDS57824.1 hypothetical protein M093_3725 [Bacteroides uniformis str. 3978 T3 i]KDS61094.1 hypothetical protein M093_0790 [Bacteroides uniformis str. 3978 T3 i]